MRSVICLRLLIVCTIACASATLYADERIISWDSDVAVHQDGSMRVSEQLTVMAEGRQIRHGILREFPTKYKTDLGARYNTGFVVAEVLLDGRQVPYKTIKYMNGVKVYIGDESKFICPGVHVYQITYDTNRQLGYFADHDELYWNVTGLGWPFVVEHVQAHIHIPNKKLDGSSVLPDSLHIEGHTGTFGRKEQAYTASINSDNTAQIQTTRELRPHEGLTLVVNWPKGIVKQQNNFWFYVRDNWGILILLLSLLGLVGWYCWCYYITRKRIKRGPIIPLFYPPEHAGDNSPGALRYLLRMGYDSKCLAVTIVHMAVRGLLFIEHVPGSLFKSAFYILKKRTDVIVVPTEFEKRLMHIFFLHSDKVPLARDNAADSDLASAGAVCEKQFERGYAIDYFSSNSEYVTIGALITIVSMLLAAFPDFYYDAWFWILAILQGILHVVMYMLLPTYSQEGQKFKEQVDGFKMFLCTTEVERLKIIGTPPTKTPELFEQYLPYAIAFDVEEQWSKQFAPVFKELEVTGHAYQPSWYYAGHPFTALDLMFLSSSFGPTFNSAVSVSSGPISSSPTHPGSSSGSGGGGYSGGGGGGGGGGGW